VDVASRTKPRTSIMRPSDLLTFYIRNIRNIVKRAPRWFHYTDVLIYLKSEGNTFCASRARKLLNVYHSKKSFERKLETRMEHACVLEYIFLVESDN
jgi:hypothetical protein